MVSGDRRRWFWCRWPLPREVEGKTEEHSGGSGTFLFSIFFLVSFLLFFSIESREGRGAGKHFSLFVFFYFSLCVLNWKHNAGIFSFFFFSLLYLDTFPFVLCFLLLQQCGLKKGLNLSSFYETTKTIKLISSSFVSSNLLLSKSYHDIKLQT